MRRILKGIWTKNGKPWDSEVESGEEEESMRWKQQLPVVVETSIDRRYFNKERDIIELHVYADASEDTMYALAYLCSEPKKYFADLAFVIGKCRVAPMSRLSIPRLELQAAVKVVRMKEKIVKEYETKINIMQFLVRLNYNIAVAENIQTWADRETYASKIKVVSQSKKELQAQKMLEGTTKFTGKRYEIGMLWSEPEANLPNSNTSALGQLYSLERRAQRDPNLKSLYQQSKNTDVEKGFVKILDESEVKGTFEKE